MMVALQIATDTEAIDAIAKLLNSGVLVTLLGYAIFWAPRAGRALIARYDAVLEEHKAERLAFWERESLLRTMFAEQQAANREHARVVSDGVRQHVDGVGSRIEKAISDASEERSRQFRDAERHITDAIKGLDCYGRGTQSA